MRWFPAPKALIGLVEDELGETVREGYFCKLPFYEDGYLVSVASRQGAADLVLGGLQGVTLCILDGSRTQIDVANRIAGLRLCRETVGEYLKFFCSHLAHTSGVPFRVIEDPASVRLQNGHRLRDMRVKVRHQEPEGAYRAGAFQFVEDQLHRVSMRVHLDGNVDMLKSIELGEIITAMH